MSPDTIEAVRCALQTVCETGGTMDELALIEQADRIADLERQLVRQDDYYTGDRKRIANLEQQLSTLREAAQATVDEWRNSCSTEAIRALEVALQEQDKCPVASTGGADQP